MDFATRGFLNTNTVVVVLVRVGSECLKLSALFPLNVFYTKIFCRVAIEIIISYLLLFVNKKTVPTADSEHKKLIGTEKNCLFDKQSRHTI